MADTKPQRRRPITQQQHTTRPVPTPRPPSSTPPSLQINTQQFMLPRATTPNPRVVISSPTRQQLQCTIRHQLHSWVWGLPKDNAAVLLHDNNIRNDQLLKPPSSTRPRLQVAGCYTTTYAAPRYYIEAPKYCSSTSHTTKAPEYLSRLRSTTQLRMPRQLSTPRLTITTLLPATTPRLQLIAPQKWSNTTQKLPVRNHSKLCHRAAIGCCIDDGLVDHWCADVSWVWRALTTAYATTGYYTEVPKCYTSKASEYYTTAYVAPSHDAS